MSRSSSAGLIQREVEFGRIGKTYLSAGYRSLIVD
jgi:hypothetical protein